MKKKLSYSLFVLPVFLLMFGSCKKDSQTQAGTPIAHHSTTRTLADDYAMNADNPYDDIGYNHNLGLQATRATWTDPNATKTDAYNALVTYCNSQKIDVTMTQDEIDNMVTAIQNDAKNNCVNFVGATSLSTQAKSYEVQIFALGSDLSKYQRYSDYRTAMINLESTIIADRSVSAADKEAVLSSASVARHTVLYWAHEAIGDNAQPNANPSGPLQTDSFLSKWWNNINWGSVAVADIGGALGGIASVAGAFFGALGASIAASV